MPGIGKVAIRSVIAGWRPGRIAVGVLGGHRVHPTVMAPEHWVEAVSMAAADEGARRFLSAFPHLIDEVEVSVNPLDLDTPADIERWAEHSYPPANGGSTSTTAPG